MSLLRFLLLEVPILGGGRGQIMYSPFSDSTLRINITMAQCRGRSVPHLPICARYKL